MVRRLGVVAVVVAVAVAVAGLAPVAAAHPADTSPASTPPADTPPASTPPASTRTVQAAGGFADVTGGVHKPAIDALAGRGVFDGTECAEDMFCPGGEMKRWTMAVWLVRVLDEAEPPPATESSFADVDADDRWLPHIERLAELEVTKGCLVDPLRFCPDRSVNRAEMATFLARALDLEAADPAGFADTAGNFHAASIDALAAARITAGCASEPRRYCPDRPVNRAETATFLARALGLVEIPEPAPEDDPKEPPKLPGEGVRVTAARANWQAGYFQAELYKLLLEELGYDVSDPAEIELGPANAYQAMALGDIDYWPNSWYPGHLAWHAAQLPDGTLVGDHLEIVGTEMLAGGLQGFLVDKSFADTFGVYTMDELDRNAAALAAFDATDPVPGNGKADVFGCPTTWTCDNIITNMIAFSGWDNIAQVTDNYDDMFDRAVASIEEGIPTVIYTWTPSAYIARLRPGEDVYWMGMENILDDSNPADQPNGQDHTQRGLDGTGGYAPIGADQCPSAAGEPGGRCKIGWFASDIQVTANRGFLAANPAARALFEAVELPVIEVSQINVAVSRGSSPAGQAVKWIAENRALVDEWLTAALGRPPPEPADEPDPPPTAATADPSACRPPGTPYTTAGFPLPRVAAPSIGTMRVAVLFMDFPDVPATYPTRDEAALGLPYAEEYLEASSYGRIDVEFVPLHGWLRAGFGFEDYLQEYAIGESRVAPSDEAIRLADPSFDFAGIHAVMTVLPSSRFQAGNHTLGLVHTDEKAIRLMAEVNTAPLDEPRDPSPWGHVAAHELAHSLGLSDLYPYDASRHELPEAPAGRIWVRGEFGLMGLNTAFVTHPDDGRLEITGRYTYGPRVTGHTFYLNAAEMLAWSRWQLGWLDESQVLCLTADRSRVMLSPVADPGDAAVMAAVPLSDTEVLVVEVRVKAGYDAEQERRHSDGALITVPALATEGVLVYTVDASLGSGELPLKIAGDAGNGQVDDYPILTSGDQVVVRGYRITFVSGRGGTYIVAIFKTGT